MKFALLIATTAALRIRSQGSGSTGGKGPSCDDIEQGLFKHCDADGDDHITWTEAVKCGAPKKFKPQFEAVAGKDGAVSRDEFAEECAKHMGLAEVEGGHCKPMWRHIRKQCDANDDKTISWDEAKACGAPAEFKPQFDDAAGTDGEVSKGEFMKACKSHGGLAEVEEEEEMGKGGCKQIWRHIRNQCDANDDKTISWTEAKDCGAPEEFKPKFDHAAGTDGEVSRKEFMKACKNHM